MANFDSIKDAGWKYVDSKTGTTAIPLPSEFEELFIMVKLGSYSLRFPMTIPRAALSTTAVFFREGYYANSGSNGYVEVGVTTSVVTLQGATSGGTDVKNSCETTVYYK